MLRSAVCVRVGLALIIGVLFCTLGVLELPELVKLTDNTSNDYSTRIFQNQKASTVEQDRQVPNVVPNVTLAAGLLQPKGERQTVWQTRYVQSVCAAPSDSLHFFCILRT